MSIKIRNALPSDAKKLACFFLEARRSTFYWQDPSRFHLEDFDKQTQDEVVILAENDQSEILGFISVWTKDLPAFIHHLYISVNHQRNGLGTLLLQSLFSWLPLPYRLKCVIKNQKALAFYEKTGWYELEQGFSEDEEYILLELNTKFS